MKKRIFLFAFLLICVCTLNVVVISFVNKTGIATATLLGEIQALASSEDWEGKNLKKVDCECPNGKKGWSIRCADDGDLESCTATQQGSNACYKIKMLEQNVETLCEGDGITYTIN